MKSIELRQRFIDFFKSKSHTFIPSSPMVIKDDPTLLFVNAGMNQFKEFFLGNKAIEIPRVVNSQKCLRVSGKHNDLEEVGHDTYHHTMFEMLGNWSFGDYFKRKAINLAWDFLTKELEISEDRLFVTFFAGDRDDQLKKDSETYSIWNKIIQKDKIIEGSKKDNFWEMGQVGPCGPSTEIHIDLRSKEARNKVNTKELINKDHPQVIEIWNIVFIEFNRKENGNLDVLPNKHVDTGMGFERLCMVLQNKTSTYDTDIFAKLISDVSNISEINYGSHIDTDIAIRVVVDHIRAIGFSIADGQLPSNNGAGYVIRRILRRAVRYGYTYLNLKDPFLFKLIPTLCRQFQIVFPEIHAQKSFIQSVIEQEEKMFLKTLGKGLDLINHAINSLDDCSHEMSGKNVFELYDTYGFPPDLTSLILKEKDLFYNKLEFDKEMEKQKSRSRSASEIHVGDWFEVHNISMEGFIGYDFETHISKIIKYRKVNYKGKERYHIVFNKTPFYPEGGGQIGDSGIMQNNENEIISIIDTKKESNMILHIVDLLPLEIQSEYQLIPDKEKRVLVTRNHSATHLLHYILRNILGDHVQQKGSYVSEKYFRFDFSHFEKISKSKLLEIEKEINDLIIKGVKLDEFRKVPFEKAKKMGALALFGEKYDNEVRVIQFGGSIELCGGTHVKNTSELGLIKIVSESSVSSGIRRIEAVTSSRALEIINDKILHLDEIAVLLKNSDNLIGAIKKIINENQALASQVNAFKNRKTKSLINELHNSASVVNGIKLISKELVVEVAEMKNICFSLINKHDDLCVVLITQKDKKIILNIALSKKLIKDTSLNAVQMVNQVAKYINGKGGGQAFFAVASGDLKNDVNKVFEDVKKIIIAC